MRFDASSPDPRFLLTGVRWETYEALLADVGDGSLRLTYADGELELSIPDGPSNRHRCRLRRLVADLTEVLAIPIDGCGSTTLRRRDMEKGLEPDEAFYVQNEPRVRGKMDMDLSVDPPPDLAIEIDITSRWVDRDGIYAAIGVPEHWRYDGDSLRIFRLRPDGKYERTEVSPAFPFLPIAEFAEFFDPLPGEDQTTWSKRFRAWVRQRVLPLYQAGRA